MGRRPAHRGRRSVGRREALREAQDKLAEALEKGASDDEIKKLMQELRQALSKYVEQLAKNAGPDAAGRAGPQNQQLSQQDLERMMKNLEDMTKNGSRDQAQQMLAQMRDLLERLQSGQVSKQEGSAAR